MGLGWTTIHLMVIDTALISEMDGVCRGGERRR